MPRRRPITLSRTDVRQRTDRPTNSVILQYTGRHLAFDDYLYGYPDGTFFAVNLSEVPYPEDLDALARRHRINIEGLPETPQLQHAVAEALVAQAMVEAPELLGDLARPAAVWQEYDRRELERRHQIALSRVAEITRRLQTDIELRAAGLRSPDLRVPSVEPMLGPPPVSFYETPAAPEPSTPPLVAATAPPAPAVTEEVEDVEFEEEDSFSPGSKTVTRATSAVVRAREEELPQRLPRGARRRLKQMPPGQYIAYGEAMDVRGDLCGAMTDARNMSRKGKESVVIDYDGEWPVVVRRYGQGGRTIYKVETALRRAGITVEAA